MIVRFNCAQEFLDELSKVRDLIGIVRVTRSYAGGYPMRRLSVVATVRVNDEIVRLDFLCGDIYPGMGADVPVNKPANDAADQVVSLITSKVEEMGLDVRTGIWEAAA